MEEQIIQKRETLILNKKRWTHESKSNAANILNTILYLNT